MPQEETMTSPTCHDIESVPALPRPILLRQIIEALLFSSTEALSLEKIREIAGSYFPVRRGEIEESLAALRQEYKQTQRAFQIEEIAEGYLLRTSPHLASFVESLRKTQRNDKLSKAATEVLAIIAYRQPITRREIDEIRGVESSGPLAALQERGLVTVVGRKEVVGRPLQYGVTARFLHHFGLKNTEEFRHLAASQG